MTPVRFEPVSMMSLIEDQYECPHFNFSFLYVLLAFLKFLYVVLFLGSFIFLNNLPHRLMSDLTVLLIHGFFTLFPLSILDEMYFFVRSDTVKQNLYNIS